MEKFALITGASRGIGRATAVALAGEGFNVFVNYLKNDLEAEKVQKMVNYKGRTAYL